MPREHREIVFSRQELSQALYDYARLQKPDADIGNPKIASIAGAPEVSVTVQFGGEEIAYGAAEVTAALIRYAKKIGLPLARDAQKALSAGEDELVLELWLGE